MKKFIYLLMCVGVFMFPSCEKLTTQEFDFKAEFKNSESLLYSKLMNVENYSDRTLSYSMLNNNERFKIWKNRIDYFLKLNITKEQRTLVEKFDSYLNESLFEDGDDKVIFKNVWLPKWIDEAKPHLNEGIIYTLIFTLNPLSNNLLNDQNYLESLHAQVVPDEPCHCSVNSNYSCLFFIMSLPKFGICMDIEKCIESSRGCGALLDDRCDGDYCLYVST